MAPDRHLHENIYVSLKSLLLSHRYRPGEPIDLKALADQFGASVTPVRDGLCRLVGVKRRSKGTPYRRRRGTPFSDMMLVS